MVEAAFRQLDAIAAEALPKSAMAGGYVIQAGMKRRIMQGGKTGRIYKRGNRQHQASAPGEPPATDYGALVNSIETRISESSADYAESETGPTVAYGEGLEYGTSRMEARPYGRPTLDEDAEQIKDAIETSLTRLLQKAAE